MIEAGARHPEMPPAWSPADLFTIQKYKDPKKDGAYLDFVEKKEKKLRHFDKIIEDTAGEIAKLQARLQRAKANKTKAEKSLRDARTRRS
jgi:glutaredoxin 2